MKKLFVIFSLLCAVMIEMPTYAMEQCQNNPQTQSVQEIETRAEEVEWVYRTYEGKLQKRLWSITEGVWLTGWIDC